MAYVPVKVYRNNEIRRFLLEAGENQRFAFQQLLNQVHLVFPNLDISRVKVMWKDTDGELIVMSSDLELMDAIRSLPANDQMLRLHLVDTVAGAQPEPVATPDVVVIFQEQPQQQEQEPQRQEDGQQQADAEEPMDQDPTRHRHVFCDGCRGSIIGIRHKCLVCPDYDLCPDCIQKGTHDEHVMIRIVSPKDKSWKPAFFAAQSPFPFRPHGRGGCGRGPWMPHHGPDARGPFPPAPPAGPQGPQGPFPPPFFHHRGGHHHRGAGPCFRGRHMHGWAPTCPARFPEEKKQEQTPGQEKPQEPQEGATLFNSQELARDVNDAIQSLMAAFGILSGQPDGAETTPKVPETTPPTANTTTNGPNSAPAAAAAETTPAPAAHPDPKIAAALNYMLAMGYRNDGGWLTKLLEEKHGDISAVLDMLHPNPGQ